MALFPNSSHCRASVPRTRWAITKAGPRPCQRHRGILLVRPIQPHAVPQHRVKSPAHTLPVRSQNSHNHLLLAVRVLWLHFQLLHVAVANLGPLSRALAFGPCKRERRVPSSCVRGLLPPTSLGAHPEPPGSQEAQQLAPGCPRTGRRRGTSRALTVHACGTQRQEQQEQRGR